MNALAPRILSALLGGVCALLGTVLCIGLYAALTTAPTGLGWAVLGVWLVAVAALGAGSVRLLRGTPPRLAAALPLLVSLMVHGAVHGPALSLVTGMLLAFVLLHSRLALALGVAVACITPVVGLSVGIQGGLRLSTLTLTALPLLMLTVRHSRADVRGQLRDPRLMALMLAGSVGVGLSQLDQQPAFVVLTLSAVTALLWPSTVFQQLRHVIVRHRHVPPRGIDAGVTKEQ